MRALLLYLLFVPTFASAQEGLLDMARKNITEIFKSSEACESINAQFEQADISENRLLLGYKGAVEMGMARHASNPFKKMGYFSKGKEHLDDAINRDTADIELRFLRLTIQVNLPSFLGYSGNIESDKTYVLKNLEATKNQEFITRVRNFISHAEKAGKI